MSKIQLILVGDPHYNYLQKQSIGLKFIVILKLP